MKPIPNSVWLNLGQRIADIRRSQGISQLQLAEMADISKEHLSNLERGNKLPSAKTLTQISNALPDARLIISTIAWSPKIIKL